MTISLKNFFRQVGTKAHMQAIKTEDESISYGRLIDSCNTITASIKESDLFTPKHPVILYGHKQWQMIAGMLAAIKLNVPFIPVDSSTPIERLKLIYHVSNASLVLDFNSNKNDNFNNETINRIHLTDCVSATPPPDETVEMTASDTLYIIFTSGTTGTPKGVKISIEALEDFVQWTSKNLIGRDFHKDVLVNHALFSFDLSVFEIWTSLINFQTLLLLDHQNNLNTRRNIELLNQAQASIWISTPSFADLCSIDPKFSSQSIPSLKEFIFCGEALSKSTVRKLYNKFPKANIFNLYGPTEATCATTGIKITEQHLKSEKALPIGNAKPNTIVRLSKSNEIEIIGKNVSTGYINASNSDKFFIENGMRGYKTGDLGEVDKLGTLFCKGRLDRQIKFKGYRIELDEIESVINDHPLVISCAAIAINNDSGNIEKLLAFVKTQGNQQADIRSNIKNNLPEYMLPEKCHIIPSLPLTKNGKIDRSTLQKNWHNLIKKAN